MGVVQQGGGLPPSLQYLAGLDQIIVKQKIEALEGKTSHIFTIKMSNSRDKIL
jgi:hypothetical protein